MKKLSINQLDLAGRRLFIRVDFNVPLEASKVQDDTRIRAAIPTIKHAVEAGARVTLASHLGRPKGKPNPEMSLKPAADRLAELLGQPVAFSAETVGPEAKKNVEALANGDVLVLENVRFDPGETDNNPEFAGKLAELAEVYVNDAFGTAHRAHASTVGMVEHFPKAAAGFLMEKELHYLDMALSDPPHPFTGLLGGAKVSDKIEVVKNLLAKVDRLLIGGGMAYTFLRAKGIETGNSLVEEDKLDLAREILERAGDKLVLPTDHVVAAAFDENAERKTVPIDQIPDGWMGLDIGPQTIAAYDDIIQQSKIIVWNGPMGVFEKEPFAQGTLNVAEAVASSEATSIVGGGDSVSAVHKSGVSERITHISTGGGASLEFLAGLKLPGVEVLTDA
jgi:phosphoglycerate kinase